MLVDFAKGTPDKAQQNCHSANDRIARGGKQEIVAVNALRIGKACKKMQIQPSSYASQTTGKHKNKTLIIIKINCRYPAQSTTKKQLTRWANKIDLLTKTQ
jgi:hypothetical protein